MSRPDGKVTGHMRRAQREGKDPDKMDRIQDIPVGPSIYEKSLNQINKVYVCTNMYRCIVHDV